MTLVEIRDITVAYVQAHQAMGPWIVGALAFGESLALVSLLIPATALLVGIGALIGLSGIEFAPLWTGAVVGAVLGDWVSYVLGRRYKQGIVAVWPFYKYPDLLERGETFVRKHGAWGVFVGKFFGPLRAFVPLAAGIFAMPTFLFLMVSISSTMVWAMLLLAPGALGIPTVLG
jgi:membrane protein DedA with SNARE-associated domain